MADALAREGDATEAGRQILEAVLVYLRLHPSAADTLEGIAAWWIRGLGDNVPRATLASQLDALVNAGELRRISTPDGGILYASVRTREAGN